jgi:putative ABC transport system permease protein
MLIADALQLALRAITAQRLRSFLTLLGIAVGIAAVILLTSIGEGIHRFVLGEFTQFGTNVVTAIPGKTKTGGSPSGLPSSARPLSLDDAKSLERLPHVVAVTPNVRGNAEVEGNGRTRRTLIYGVNANLPKIFRSTVQSGQFLPADDESSARAFVVLGSKVKNELFGSENPLGQRLRIGGLHFPRHRRHGTQRAVSRHRSRRHRLHPDRPRPGVIQP